MRKTLFITAVALGMLAAGPALADLPYYAGEVRVFGINYCPQNWMQANGGLLRIMQYQQLFSVLGGDIVFDKPKGTIGGLGPVAVDANWHLKAYRPSTL